MIKFNPELKNLEAIDQLSAGSIINWIQLIGLKTPKGWPFEWKDHGYLIQPLTDWAPRLVFKKASQLGFSLISLLKILYQASRRGISTIYTLPTTSDVRKFVAARVDPMIENCPYLYAKMRPTGSALADSTELKRIGNSTLYFRGSFAETVAQTIDSDINVIDELDFSKPDIAEMYEERLEGSNSLNWMYQFSVPSIPGFGVDKLYEDSCQYKWYVRCSKCSKLQTLSFEYNIDQIKRIYVCKFCKNELTDEDRRSGIWVAKYPERPVHGYHISQLAAPWISADRILKKEEKARSKKHFYNYTLGEAYHMQTRLITENEIYGMQTGPEESSSAQATVFGIDQGDNFYVAIGRLEKIEDSKLFQKRILALRIVKSEEDLQDLIKRFDMRLGIMDAMPNKHTANKLAELYKGRLFLAFYQTGRAAKEKFELSQWNLSAQQVHIQRTESLDKLIESLDKRQWVLPALSENVKVLIKHVKNISINYSILFGQKTKLYVKSGPDDFFHALNYLNIAFEKSSRFMLGSGTATPQVKYGRIGLDEIKKDEIPSVEEIQSERQGGFTHIDISE